MKIVNSLFFSLLFYSFYTNTMEIGHNSDAVMPVPKGAFSPFQRPPNKFKEIMQRTHNDVDAAFLYAKFLDFNTVDSSIFIKRGAQEKTVNELARLIDSTGSVYKALLEISFSNAVTEQEKARKSRKMQILLRSNLTDANNTTPLMSAVINQDYYLVKLLLPLSKNIDAEDDYGNTALLHAIKTALDYLDNFRQEPSNTDEINEYMNDIERSSNIIVLFENYKPDLHKKNKDLEDAIALTNKYKVKRLNYLKTIKQMGLNIRRDRDE